MRSNYTNAVGFEPPQPAEQLLVRSIWVFLICGDNSIVFRLSLNINIKNSASCLLAARAVACRVAHTFQVVAALYVYFYNDEGLANKSTD